MLENKPAKYDSVQMLRGLAALFVVWSHITLSNHNGAFGVDIFFCISGFIMMYVTERGYAKFLPKRAVRVIPLYWGMTLFTYFVILIIPQVFKTTEATPQFLIKSLFFIPYTRNGITQPVLGLGWTLNNEVAFYVLFYLAARINLRFRAEIATAFLLILVLAGIIYPNVDFVVFRFFTNAIVLEFALGMYAYKILHRMSIAPPPPPHVQRQFGKRTASVILILLTVLLIVYMFTVPLFPALEPVHRFWKYGIPAFIIFILIFVLFSRRKVPKFLVITGNISFSLYLIHPYTIYFVERVLYPLDKLTPLSLLVAVIAIAVSVGVAWISWYLVENKLTNRLRKKLNI